MSKGSTHSTTWKGFERRIARTLGVERESKKGLGLATPDVVAPVKAGKAQIVSIECKLTGHLSKQIQVAIDQSRQNLKSRRHIPIAVLKEKHCLDEEAVVAMRWKDFKKFLHLPGEDGEDG